MKQLRLFEFFGIDLREKLTAKRNAKTPIRYYWNGERW